ncbi:MAG TPA: aminotransferase class V-fold PLP-dependent enzyme, partial [Burkholderiales bacterium]|nr:aminotransferase class V-fold PLP-dependent enzyme [Burkholderiales bacterium]
MEYEFETLAVRSGIHRSQFNEHSDAVYLTSSFVFESAAQAAARFRGEEPGNIYARFTNPTVTSFQERLAALEGAEACVATSSVMSAILSCVMGLLNAGDHIVSSRSIFGSTVQLFGNIMKRFGVETTFVSASNVSEWEKAVRPNTRLFFVETPSNPLMELSDISSLSAIAGKAGAKLAVDNCFCTPAIQKPIELGADIVIHSATKYLDGQGRVLGGAVLGSNESMEGVKNFLRTAGP